MTGFNSETIDFFKNVKNLLLLDENDRLDRDNVKHVFLDDSSLTREKLWICGLLPDFFHEGCKIFKDYCFYHLNRTDYDKCILPKFKYGDFSAFKPYEEQYQHFQIISRFFNENIKKVHEETVRQLWDSKRIFPEELKGDIKRHRDVYDQIVSNEGNFKGYDDAGVLANLKFKHSDEFLKKLGIDRETAEFAYKICHFYRMSHYLDGLDCFDEISEERKSNRHRDEEKKEIDALEKNIRKVKRKMLIDKILFRNKDKQQDKDELEKLQGELIRTKNRYNEDRFMSDFLRQKRKVIKGYRKKHNAISSKMLRSMFERQVIPTLDGKQREDVGKLFNRIIKTYYQEQNFQETNSMPLNELKNSFSHYENIPFDRHNDAFYNAIENVGRIANVVLEFDSMESKDFNSLISIIRSELAGVPRDFTHRNVLSNEYRKEPLRPLFSKMVEMGQIKNIPQNMDNLGVDFKSLMSEENTDEYIKKVGIMWYKLIAIHPFMDGNGRTSRYFMNTMLAYKNIVVPSFFSTIDERKEFYHNLDGIMNKSDNFNLLGESFLKTVKEEGFNLVDGKPLTPVQEKESQISLGIERHI